MDVVFYIVNVLFYLNIVFQAKSYQVRVYNIGFT